MTELTTKSYDNLRDVLRQSYDIYKTKSYDNCDTFEMSYHINSS